MSAGERPHHLWVWIEQDGTWISAGHGTAEEMHTAKTVTEQARAVIGADELDLVVAVDRPPLGDADSRPHSDESAVNLVADRARADAVTALAAIGGGTEDPVYLAFAASTYAVAAEMHAFRVALVDELRAIRREIRR